MLLLDGEAFCASRATFSDRADGTKSSTAKIFVRVRVGGIDGEIYALLDTGAPFSILDLEVAETAGIQLGTGHRTGVDTRRGLFEGELVRHDLTLCADDGDSLTLDTTIFVPDKPMGQAFLGYTSLEAIRLALDVSRNHVYFGKA